MEHASKKWMKWGILAAALVAVFIILTFYVDYLWFDSIHYQAVFVKTLLLKIATWGGVGLFIFILLELNTWLTLKKCSGKFHSPLNDNIFSQNGKQYINIGEVMASALNSKYAKWVLVVLNIVIAVMLASGFNNDWLTIQEYIQKTDFNITDPLFGNDIGFYFFTVPFLKIIYEVLILTFIVSLITSIVIYGLSDQLSFSRQTWREFTIAKFHLAFLVALLLLMKTFGYQLNIYDLLYAQHDLVFGATYMDVHAHILGYHILMFISVVAAVLIIVNLFIRKFLWIVFALGIWIASSIILTGIYPQIVQQLVVQPNEFNCEKPYLENAIKYTRLAYGLDDVETREFPIDYNLTAEDIQNNEVSIENIRLWDWKPLLDTYKNLQELRLYYVFNDVDIDRYTIDGSYRQIMLSAREMEDMQQNDALSDEAKTWINYRLMFTHGYGIAASPVNEVAEEGFPRFLIKDIPPQFSSDLTVKRPEIYFGESTDSYIIVNTKQSEFNYPMGEQNVYSDYEGNLGIKISSIFRRILLATKLGDYKMLLSGDITNDSQLLMTRNIFDRAQELAPYLNLDSDAYIVVGSDGGLYWILDGYTTSNCYPYSQPFTEAGNNYIRNSVKIVCNAYTGEMNFYVIDKNDPIAVTYSKIFPDLYKNIDEMPEDLYAHLHYPEQIFEIQADIFRTYHMEDPWVFYNKEDSWVVADEIVQDAEQEYTPYYLVTRLPGEEKEEYIIMLPYTPNSRLNLNAWICGRMDGDNYGKLILYQLPKQETVYGPMQIEARIDQNTEISQQLTLWNQGGSQIYRGNLLIIPIENSLLYVEPLYLQSETSAMPELKRVIVSYHNTIVMEADLETALNKIFHLDENGEALSASDALYDDASTKDIEQLIKDAYNYYNSANSAIQSGNWSEYGTYINELGDVLNYMQQSVNGTETPDNAEINGDSTNMPATEPENTVPTENTGNN